MTDCSTPNAFSLKKGGGGAIAPFAPPLATPLTLYTKRVVLRRMERVIFWFLFWCGNPLVPLLFHGVTSLHPPSFQRNDFSTCISIHQYDYVIGCKKQQCHDQLEEFLERMLEVLKYR